MNQTIAAMDTQIDQLEKKYPEISLLGVSRGQFQCRGRADNVPLATMTSAVSTRPL